MKSQNVLLKDYSYYRTGGSCAVFYAPKTIEEGAEALREIKRLGLPYFLIGAGTNSLVLDDPWHGAVISFHELQTVSVEGTSITCGAGVTNTKLAQIAQSHGLQDAEWMFHLPGQVGASVRMNARCYGGEMEQVVTRIDCLTANGEVRSFEHRAGDKSIFRGYKDTMFMREPLLIMSATFGLRPGDPDEIARKMQFCADDRASKQQFAFPNCGCVFKNNYAPEVSVPSGMLLDRVGIKGLNHKGAAVSECHANFVFNKGATSRAIIELTLEMRERVWTQFGVWMEYEMEILGALPPDLYTRIHEQRTPAYDHEALQGLRREFQARA